MTTQTKRSRSQPLRGHSIDYSVRTHNAASVNHYADTSLTTWTLAVNCWWPLTDFKRTIRPKKFLGAQCTLIPNSKICLIGCGLSNDPRALCAILYSVQSEYKIRNLTLRQTNLNHCVSRIIDHWSRYRITWIAGPRPHIHCQKI